MCLSTGGKGKPKEAKGRPNPMAVSNIKARVTKFTQRTRPKPPNRSTILANQRRLPNYPKIAMAV